MTTDTHIYDDRTALRARIEGYQHTQAIAVAAQLGLADLIVSGTRDPASLAEVTGADRQSLIRLLRALASIGIFAEEPDGTFRMTPLAGGLRTDTPDSLHAWAIQAGQPEMWSAWGDLLHSVTTGESAFRHANATDVWSYRARKPEAGARFDAAMEEGARAIAAALVDAYPFSEREVIVDVGGGTGSLLLAVLEAHPHLRAILFDQPQVVARAAERFADPSLRERIAFAGGDFFETIPEDGDCYLLKGIIHDWDDHNARRILANCHRLMPEGSRLLLIEQILPETGSASSLGQFMDLHMLVIHGACECTQRDLAALLDSTGFTVARTIPTVTGLHIIETMKR